MTPHSVTIMGLGKVGTAWLNILPEAGYRVTSVISHKEVNASLIKSHPDTQFITGSFTNKNELGQFIFITVPDDVIDAVSDDLAKNATDLKGKYVVHCSGVMTSEILHSVRDKGAKTASFHPIKAITEKNESFDGIWFDMEGDEEVLSELELLCQKLEANAFRVKPSAKPYLHASAVVASNYLVVLTDMFTKIAAQGGVSKEIAIKALTPLMLNTLSNIKDLGPEDALTGPIARGDVQTIEQHIESLKNDADLLSLYKTLGKSAVEIAQKKSGNSEALITIKKLLT